MAQDEKTQQQKNTEARWEAFTRVGIATVVAAGLTACVFLIGGYKTQAYEETTKRVVACTEAGGSWVDVYDLCINESTK